MPKLEFMKMNGAGNDFVMLDNRRGEVQLGREQIARLCDRHRGIGADGVLMVEPATNGADFRMRYYNADGGEAEMCGNGARCFARFADRVAGPRQRISFETPAGVIAAALADEGVTLEMSEPRDLRLNLQISALGQDIRCHSVDSGVPHVVIPVEDISRVDVRALGSAVRHHPEFAPRGANVNFLEQRGASAIAIRTFERGVEDETLACGTGVVASALLFAATQGAPSPVHVRVKGGDDLQVGFVKEGEHFRNVTLSGPAEFVFEGTVEL
jgi:diaminopimelate epimerase